MKAFKGLLVLATGILFYILVRYSTSNHVVQDAQTKKLYIVCTTSMIADAVHNVAGDLVEVHALMGPGVDPHLYKARAGDVQKLQKADIIFYNGLHLEGKMGDLFASLKSSKRTEAVADAIPKNKLLEVGIEGVYDPHIWHDVSLWVAIVEYIAQVLAQEDLRNAAYYERHAAGYKHLLQELDVHIKKTIDRLPPGHRILVTAHDAFHYFGKAYGLQVVGLQGISTDSEISIKDIRDLADFIATHSVRAIFIESSLPERNIQAVQKAVQARGSSVQLGQELYSDALGAEGSDAATYDTMMRHNVETIVAALSGRG
ncbi:MAG: metal ABC transporter solute-binding protein, Zn/Mn family [Candidatus Babeliales bacterium]